MRVTRTGDGADRPRPRTARPGADSGAAPDRGFSLVEILVAVLLLGIVGASVLTAAAASARGSSVNRSVADVQLALLSAADALTGTAPVACTTAQATYTGVGKSRIDSLALRTGLTFSVGPVQSFVATSPQDVHPCRPSEIQQISLTVVSVDRKVTRSIDVLSGGPPLAAPTTTVAAATTTSVSAATSTSVAASTTSVSAATSTSIPSATSTSVAGATTTTSVASATTTSTPAASTTTSVVASTTTSIAATTTTAATPTVNIGNPLQFGNSDFSMVARGNVTINGTQVYGALGVGGNLNFSTSGPIAANSVGTISPTNGSASNLGLIVDGQVNLTSGVLYVNNGASASVGSMSGQQYVAPGGTNCLVPLGASTTQCTAPAVNMQGGGNVVTGHPYAFATAFDSFAKTSAAMASLPGTCANAATATLRDQNNQAAWSGSGNYTLVLTPGKANVLNLTVAQVNAMASGNAAGSSSAASSTTPLIINVTDAGAVNFTSPNFPQNYPTSVIWNFPNATSVAFSNALWGSLYAPKAAVTLTADVRGVVIAGSVVANAGVTDWSNRPSVVVNCNRAA